MSGHRNGDPLVGVAVSVGQHPYATVHRARLSFSRAA